MNIAYVLECAGRGAISNGKFGGVYLRDALLQALKVESADVEKLYEASVGKHVIFVSEDGLQASIPLETALNPYADVILATEMNGVNDNPVIDPHAGEALHGGNFYGGHACLATDTLKNVVANQKYVSSGTGRWTGFVRK